MHAAIATLLLVVGQNCESCGSAGCTGGACGGDGLTFCQRWFCGPMPQTCYQPAYGCYPGNARTIQRYPAFHGTYYRCPYNWRNEFDYPWQAEPHEPTSLFSYQVEAENGGLDGRPGEVIIEDDAEMLDPPPALPDSSGAVFEESNTPRVNRRPATHSKRQAARAAPNRAARAIRPMDGTTTARATRSR